MKAILLFALLTLPLTAQEPAKAVSIFDGKTLTGWKAVNPANAKMWSVADGSITAGDGKNKIRTNTYLATEKEYGDLVNASLLKINSFLYLLINR